MEPITATPATVLTPASPAAVSARPALPRPVLWTALIIALALPAILLATLVILMVATQYNFLNWME